jgi:hypothetical protein
MTSLVTEERYRELVDLAVQLSVALPAACVMARPVIGQLYAARTSPDGRLSP